MAFHEKWMISPMTKFRDLAGGVFFLAFSVFIYAVSYQIRLTKADPLGPQFFPRMVAILIGALAIASIVRSLLRLREKIAIVAGGGNNNTNTRLSFWGTIVLLIAYMLLVEKVGFIVLSIIYLYLQIYLVSPRDDLQKRNFVINGVVSIVVPLALYYLFYHAFGIFLPPGILD